MDDKKYIIKCSLPSYHLPDLLDHGFIMVPLFFANISSSWYVHTQHEPLEFIKRVYKDTTYVDISYPDQFMQVQRRSNIINIIQCGNTYYACRYDFNSPCLVEILTCVGIYEAVELKARL